MPATQKPNGSGEQKERVGNADPSGLDPATGRGKSV
jgi:hypothetical protein